MTWPSFAFITAFFHYPFHTCFTLWMSLSWLWFFSPDAMTQIFTLKGSEPLLVLPKLGCGIFPFILMTGQGSSMRCPCISSIPSIFFLILMVIKVPVSPLVVRIDQYSHCFWVRPMRSTKCPGVLHIVILVSPSGSTPTFGGEITRTTEPKVTVISTPSFADQITVGNNEWCCSYFHPLSPGWVSPGYERHSTIY